MAIGTPMGSALSMGLLFKRLIITVFFTSIIVIFLAALSNINLISYQAEAGTANARAYYSIDGISYFDPLSGRVYAGTIDLEKFENNSIKILQKSMDFGEDKHLGARFILRETNGKEITSAVYNPKTFKEIARKGIAGPGGVDVVDKQLYVLVKDKTHKRGAILDITIVIERSR